MDPCFPPGDVRRYGAIGDGFTNDQAAIAGAIAQFVKVDGAPLWFEPDKTYFLGDQSGGAAALRVEGATRKVICGNGATLRIKTIDRSAPAILELVDCRHIAIHRLRGVDAGADFKMSVGAICFDIVATGFDDADIGHVSLVDCGAESATAFVRVRGNVDGPISTNQANRIRNVQVRGGLVKHVFYGINCQNHGDDVSVDAHMEDVIRAYFVYGVTGHRFHLDVRDPNGGYSQCLIKAYDRSTSDIKGSLRFEGSHSTYECVTLEFQNATQTQSIGDIDIDLRCCDELELIPLTFRAFDEAGVVRTTTDNRWDYVRLSGEVSESAKPVVFASIPQVPPRLVLDLAFASSCGP